MDNIKDMFFHVNLFPYSNDLLKKDIPQIIKNSCNDKSAEIIQIADNVLNKKFSIFERNIEFNSIIDWHYSFFNDYNWPIKFINNIQIRPKNYLIDVKYTWEFNRHQFFTYLGYAYFITKNEKYAHEFKKLILDWIKKNPPLIGINWYSPLEISIRLINWIFTLFFFKDSPNINNKYFFKKIFKSMFQQAYYLRYFYTKNKFNHTIGELFGLYLFSRIFSKFELINKWKIYSNNKLRSQINLQTRQDGVNIEQSLNYHRFVLEFFTLFLIINPQTLDNRNLNLVEQMYDYLLYTICPDRSFPLIGDFDDGSILLLNYNKEELFIQLMVIGEILFKRADLKFVTKDIYPSAILLTGAEGYTIYNNLKSEMPIKKYIYFENSGYFSIRNNWSDNANYLFCDFAKFGPLNAGHTHSSFTNFIFSFGGVNIIIDSGTYSYNKSFEERNYFRSSIAHNILTIDHKNQAKIKSWFSWKNKPKIQRKLGIKNGKIAIIGIHDGYIGFLVKRNIEINKELDYMIIKDKIIQKQNIRDGKLYEIDLYYHLNKDIKIIVNDHKAIINNQLILEIICEQAYNLKLEKSIYSPFYGFKYENKALKINLKCSFEINKTLTITTIIKALNKN